MSGKEPSYGLEHAVRMPDEGHTLRIDDGKKADGGKLDWTLLDFEALSEVAQVGQYGAMRYARDNWRKMVDPNRYLAAAFRHLFAYARGERIDPESGLSHAGHVAWNMMALIAFDSTPTSSSTYRGNSPTPYKE